MEPKTHYFLAREYDVIKQMGSLNCLRFFVMKQQSVHAIFDAIFTMGHPETVSLCFSTWVRLCTSDPPYPTVVGSLCGTGGNDDDDRYTSIRNVRDESHLRGGANKERVDQEGKVVAYPE
ncbi:unnamed protein product [Cuscuta europaea]|uniref:Uncharacterized protein n=1 Tax=Cuscuta europaea TaxID=41803 RepID=A0A9P1E7L3_CUSEU|nr:unnamed protein product [Cuscuta europaea]